MANRVNKLYKPADLVAAIDAVQTAEVAKKLHAAGWKVVKVNDGP